jgi:hypothetical protein
MTSFGLDQIFKQFLQIFVNKTAGEAEVSSGQKMRNKLVQKFQRKLTKQREDG